MLDCFSYSGGTKDEIYRRHFLPARPLANGAVDLVRYTDTECFSLRKINGGEYTAKEAFFVTLVVTEDGGTLSYGNNVCSLKRGEKYFICADTEFILKDATAVLCYPPKQ